MKRMAREGTGQDRRQEGQLGSQQSSGRRERVYVDMSGVESVRGTEAPLKKESTGLGDRLVKAEGGPEMWQAGVGALGRAWQHWGPGERRLFEGERC